MYRRRVIGTQQSFAQPVENDVGSRARDLLECAIGQRVHARVVELEPLRAGTAARVRRVVPAAHAAHMVAHRDTVVHWRRTPRRDAAAHEARYVETFEREIDSQVDLFTLQEVVGTAWEKLLKVEAL